ncbi:hypothetical protein ACFQZL_06130, partial [Myroides pelagicus]
LVTNGAGAVEWVPQPEILPTTNELALNANELTSTVDGVASSVNLTEQNVVSTKNITGTGITVTGGEGSSLKDVGLSITPGLDQTMLVTNGAGVVEWIPQPEILPTTNELALNANELTSTVDGVASSVNLTEQNVVSTKNITGNEIIAVTGGEGSSLKDVNLSIKPGFDQTVLVTTGAGTVEWVPQADLNPTTNELALNANELTSTVDGVASSVNLTEQNVVSTKNITGNEIIAVTGGEGSSLKDVGLSITPGLDQTVLVTTGAGTVEWVPQADLN